MAQLKDTLITGGLRVTDTTITDILQTSAIKAPVDSASGTIGLGSNGQVLTSDGTNTYWSSDILAVNDAMVFKGTLGTGGTVASVPTNGYSTGWTYRIITAGVYAGEYCENGDLLIAINDGPATGSSIIAADWTRAQTNIDGPVFRKKNDNNSPDTFTTNRLIYSTSSGGEVASANNLYYDGTSLILQNDLNLYTSNNDRYINFTYNNNTAESVARWRLGYKGTGDADANIFVLQSTGSSSTLGSKTEFSDVLNITMNTHKITASNSITVTGGTVSDGNISNNTNGIWLTQPNKSSIKYAALYTNTIGTANTTGMVILSLGNGAASTAADNAQGRIVLYGTGQVATKIQTALTGSSRTMYFPNYDGDGYLAHTEGTAAVGNTSQPVYVAANGRVTAITGAIANSTTGSAAKLSNTAKIGDTNKPVYFTANGVPSAISYTIDKSVPSTAVFTDKYIDVTARGTTKAYLLADTTSPASNHSATAVAESDVYLDTAAGKLAATIFKLAEKVEIQYNTTTNAIDFNFI